jgi:hypothetical protein
LEAAGVTVKIGDNTLVAGTPLTLQAGESLIWQVTAGAKPMKGILFRVEAPFGVDLDSGVTGTGSGLQLATVCDLATENVVGITHTSAAAKKTVQGTIGTIQIVDNVMVDVTVVFSNNATSSFYAHSQYLVNYRDNFCPVKSAEAAQCPKGENLMKFFITKYFCREFCVSDRKARFYQFFLFCGACSA